MTTNENPMVCCQDEQSDSFSADNECLYSLNVYINFSAKDNKKQRGKLYTLVRAYVNPV